jgi:hypothetical protein
MPQNEIMTKFSKDLLDEYGPFMELPQVAEVMHITPQALYRQIYNGKLKWPYVKNGKKYLFPTDLFAHYLVENTIHPPENEKDLIENCDIYRAFHRRLSF